jgi:hypothetical protein
MPLKKARTSRSSTRPKATSSRNTADEVARARIAIHEPARSARNDTVASVDEAPPQALCDAIEDQCARPLNVLGAVHCMSIGIVTQTERFPEG